jgi:flagellar hook protein FlgE
MSILRSLTIGVSGLRANSEAMTVTGDNIANVNTVGFKRSRAVFADILTATNGPTQQAQAGVRMSHVEQVWTQGAIVTTDSPTDLAISGDGLFVLAGTMQGLDGRFYTRAGQFHFDETGTLVNMEGLKLQGYTADPTGLMGTVVGDIKIEGGTLPGSATTTIDISANLNAEDAVPAAWNAASPNTTSNFSHNVTVYDSLGASHELTVYYRKSAVGAWEWHAMADGGDITGGTAGVAQEVGTGTMTFTTSGALDTETTTPTSINFLNAAPAQAITFNFGTNITGEGGTGLDGSTQYANKSAHVALQQNGYGAGTVAAVQIESDGRITGVFSNGQQRSLGQVVTAGFADPSGLRGLSNNVWVETPESGQALIGGADAGGRGEIVSGSLEQSNVDLGTEFVNLIAYQRAFQANTRIITTSDEMYTELVNIKR